MCSNRRFGLPGFSCIWLTALLVGACSKSSNAGSDGGSPDGGDGPDGGVNSRVLDRTFGEEGVLRTRSHWSTDAVMAGERTADGKLLLGGTTVLFGHVSQLLVVRITADGQPDQGFGRGGVTLVPMFDQIHVTDLAPMTGGGAVLSGTAFMNENIAFAVRVDAEGALDPAFGEGGLVTWNGRFRTNTAVLANEDGKVLILCEGSTGAELRRLNADGSLDESFGSDGITELPGKEPREMVWLPDGRILALTAGRDDAFLHRLSTSGALDPGFASAGTYTVPFLAHDLSLSPTSDEILLAGTGSGGNRIQKLDAYGEPVAAFGTDGMVFVESSGELVQVEWHTSGEIFLLDAMVASFPHCLFRRVIRLDGDGTPLTFDESSFAGFGGDLVKRLVSDDSTLYLLGSRDVTMETPARSDSQAAALAFAPDGTGLASFGAGGLALAGSGAAPEVMWHMVAMPDGSIIASGSAATSGILARYVDGQQDLGFGTGGFAAPNLGFQFLFLAPDPSGNLLALNWGGGVIRFLADGTRDTGFTAEALPGTVRDLTLDASGRIVVAGGIAGGSGTLMLARYSPDGSLDPSFGDEGVALGLDGTDAFALAVHVDGDDKILASGERMPAGIYPDTFIARFNEDGSLDPGFGSGGVTVFEGASYLSRITSRRAGGYLLTAKTAFGTSLNVFAVDGAGQPDAAFGTEGRATVEVKGESIHGILELADGRILVADSVIRNGTGQPAIWCLRPDGHPDTSFDSGGLFVYPAQGRAVALVPDGDGVLVGGQLFSVESGTDLALMRIRP